MTSERGRFITIEGIDGCGKSTQAALLRKWLEERVAPGRVLHTFEPGGWDGGKLLRRLLLDGVPIGPRTELLLFLADRSGHLDAEILPALEEGCCVICERYTDSTLAYQSWGRGIDSEILNSLLKWCDFPLPDLTVFLDIDVRTARVRLARRGRPDRVETETTETETKGDGESFMERVARGYRELAKRNPGRIVAVDAEGSVEQVAESVRACVEKRLNLHPVSVAPVTSVSLGSGRA